MRRYIKKSVRATLQEELKRPGTKTYCVYSPYFFNRLGGAHQGKVELVVYDRLEVMWDRRR